MATRMCGRAGEPAVRKGPWTLEEDLILVSYISQNGEGSWDNLARSAGLNRNGKSCRLRWLNYLRPGVRRGSITPEEDMVIRELHSRWGNRWSKIAKHLPGRTDNEIKNYWRTKIHRKPRGRSQLLQEPCEDAMGMGMSTTTSEAASTSASSGQSQASPGVWDEYMQASSFPHPELVSFAADHHLEMAGTDEVAAAAAAAQFVPTEFGFNDGFWNFVDNFWETMPVSDVV
ncbi:MYB-like transcription factor EOBI [Oryza glaberrima]|uniref:Uncharacterized protein n=2 Tax=Oryza TaxID=4527 RepID=A0A0D3ERN6_9ORYZ|nr:MYB-like transcription factor EOBI [Oryza glaberrima]